MHHISMKCGDPCLVRKAVSFYEEIFGCHIVREWEKGIFLSNGKDSIEIFTDGEGTFLKGSIRHFAIEVEDVDKTVSLLQGRGHEITLSPKDIEVPFKARIAFCKGVLGEEIEVLEVRE